MSDIPDDLTGIDAPRPDPVPDEGQEGAAREMRQLYLALVGQNFTEAQAVRIIGHTLGTMIATGAENA